jgi:hypothetical protein
MKKLLIFVMLCLLPFNAFAATKKVFVKDERGKIVETIKPYDEKRGIYKVYDERGKVKQTIKVYK